MIHCYSATAFAHDSYYYHWSGQHTTVPNSQFQVATVLFSNSTAFEKICAELVPDGALAERHT